MDIHRARFVDYSPHTITSMAFSHKSNQSSVAPLNLRLAIGRSNGDIEIWNPRFGWVHELTVYGARGRSIEGLCWGGNDDEFPRLFSIGGSTVITEWDLKTQKPLSNYDCNAGVIWSIACSENGEQLAVGCDDGSVVIIDISGGPGSLEHSLICQRQELRVLSVCWFKNELVIGGCADARLRCWKVGHSNDNNSNDNSNDNNSNSNEPRGRLVGTMRVDKSKTESTLVWSVQVLPDVAQVVSGDSTGSVKIWDLKFFSLLQSFKVHDADVLCIVADSKSGKFFSAGVDRKIHQFQSITSTSKAMSKWIHSNSRLLHSNDVRAMAIFEANNGCNFLLSGGVEKSIVLLSVTNFHDGKYRKLSIAQQQPNVTINDNQGFVAMWQDQTIKVWKIIEQQQHKLVTKITLSNEENITSVLINESGDLLAVATLGSVKAFHLVPTKTSNKLHVKKVRDVKFDELIDGGKKVVIYDNNKLLILTTDDEIYNFQINESEIELINEIEQCPSTATPVAALPYKKNIKSMIVSESFVIVSRFDGSIEVLPIDDNQGEPYVLTRLSSSCQQLLLSNKNTLIVITEENKLYEFNVPSFGKATKKSSTSSLLTAWSKRNSEFLPKQFLTLEEKPQGMFKDKDSSRIWIYGSNWLSFFDLSENIPISKAFQNTSTSKKRDRDGLQVPDEQTSSSTTEFEGHIVDNSNNNVELLELSLKQSQIDKLREQIQNEEPEGRNTNTKKPFWMTTKYRPILCAGAFDNGIIVVELPSLVNATPAFNLPKFRV